MSMMERLRRAGKAMVDTGAKTMLKVSAAVSLLLPLMMDGSYGRFRMTGWFRLGSFGSSPSHLL